MPAFNFHVPFHFAHKIVCLSLKRFSGLVDSFFNLRGLEGQLTCLVEFIDFYSLEYFLAIVVELFLIVKQLDEVSDLKDDVLESHLDRDGWIAHVMDHHIQECFGLLVLFLE